MTSTLSKEDELMLTKDQIKHMVNSFLGWKLPENFNPDGGISFEKYGNIGTEHQYKCEPSGTNLFDATQANAMVRHMVAELPTAPVDARPSREAGPPEWCCQGMAPDLECRCEQERAAGVRNAAIEECAKVAESLLQKWTAKKIRDLALSDKGAAPFYGAQCPSYPACSGGYGLGCTHTHSPAIDARREREAIAIIRQFFADGVNRNRAEKTLDDILALKGTVQPCGVLTEEQRYALERMAGHDSRDPALSWDDNLLLIQSAAQAAKDVLASLVQCGDAQPSKEARKKEITRLATIAECVKVAEDQAQTFLSPEYASNQPFGSLCERFACEEVAKAIRALALPSTHHHTEAK